MKSFKVRLLGLACVLGCLTSCIDDKGNYSTYGTDSGVIRYYSVGSGTPFIDTRMGAFAAPELKDRNYKSGDCLLVSYTVDLDNQPSAYYYTATDVSAVQLDKSTMLLMSGNDTQDDPSYSVDSLSVDSISRISITGITPLIDGNLFLSITQKSPENQKFNYELIYHTDSVYNEVPVLYVCTEKNGTATGAASDRITYHAFDIQALLTRYMDDSNQVEVYLKYKSGEDADGNNIYKWMYSMPVKITNIAYKENND